MKNCQILIVDAFFKKTGLVKVVLQSLPFPALCYWFYHFYSHYSIRSCIFLTTRTFYDMSSNTLAVCASIRVDIQTGRTRNLTNQTDSCESPNCSVGSGCNSIVAREAKDVKWLLAGLVAKITGLGEF